MKAREFVDVLAQVRDDPLIVDWLGPSQNEILDPRTEIYPGKGAEDSNCSEPTVRPSKHITEASAVRQLNERQAFAERACLIACLKSYSSVAQFDARLSELDETLEETEKILGEFSANLQSSGPSVETMYEESTSLEKDISALTNTVAALNAFTLQFLITPKLVNQISTSPVNAVFLKALRDVTTRLAKCTELSSQYPAALQSSQQLRKLHLHGLHRVRDFLLLAVRQLAQSGANVHVLQHTDFLAKKDFYKYLLQHHVPSAQEVKDSYRAVLRNHYSLHFRQYLNALATLPIQVISPVNVVALSPPLPNRPSTPSAADHSSQQSPSSSSTTSAAFSGLLSSGLFGGRPRSEVRSTSDAVLSPFGLHNRDKLLQRLNDPPILPMPTNEKNRHHYFPEELFWSQLTLFVDVAAAEFLCLREFFFPVKEGSHHTDDGDPPTLEPTTLSAPTAQQVDEVRQNAAASTAVQDIIVEYVGGDEVSRCTLTGLVSSSPPSLLARVNKLHRDIFSRVVEQLIDCQRPWVRYSSDCVGLVLCAAITEHVRAKQRALRCKWLEKHLEELQVSLWQRLRSVLEEQTSAVSRAELTGGGFERVHVIVRRFESLCAALSTVHARYPPIRPSLTTALQQPLARLLEAVEVFVEANAAVLKKKTGGSSSSNISGLVFLINNRNALCAAQVQALLGGAVVARIETQVEADVQRYADAMLAQFMPTLVDCVNQKLPVTDLCQSARSFYSSWRRAIRTLHESVVSQLVSADAATDVVKCTLRNLIQMTRQFNEMIPEGDSAREFMVPTSDILAEVQQYLHGGAAGGCS